MSASAIHPLSEINKFQRYYDIKHEKENFTLIQTIDDNKSMFKKKEIELADQAIKLYHAIGRPSYKSFIDMLTSGHIRNCHITPQDAKNALKIYGQDEGALRGKMVQTTPKSVKTGNLYEIP